jgi:predicted enzyme related to lactoylglutathione lyase
MNQKINSESPVEKIAFALVYAEDLKKSVEFYKKYFGFIEDPEVKMGEDQIFGHMGSVGLWIGGGYKKLPTDENTARATAMLRVKSSSQLFNRMKTDGIVVIQDKHMKMNSNSFWFQFADPNGNIWDILGNE